MFANELLMMNEFGGSMDDWGLQAVVNKGFTNDCSTSTMNNYPVQSCFVPFGIQQDDFDDGVLFSSHNLFETSTVLDELEELYKPFYPVLHPLSPQAAIVTSSISVPREVKDQSQKLSLPVAAATKSATSTSRAAQSKKCRNQRKKMVLQVTADGLSADMWAWRKYGQKPIKGSPYPRSYYRCSSSKGCLARKQVEQSSSEPGMFIITYTAEHSHAHPTRRSSLAGSSRNKSSAPKKPTTSNKANTSTVKKHSSCCSPTTVLSPTTPLTSSMEDESPLAATKPESTQEHAITDLIFPSLEELDRLTSNWFSDQILPNFPCMLT